MSSAPRPRSTLVPPPPPLPHHSPIESILSLRQLHDIDPNLYTNARPLWHPPGARGIFGGAAIAQCLAAAQATLPVDREGEESPYTIHSMHCYFVLAGNSDIPVIYAVERVRDGKSFVTRTVQARQRGKVIFTTTMSFQRESPKHFTSVQHAVSMPGAEEVPPPPKINRTEDDGEWHAEGFGNGPLRTADDSPFEALRCKIGNSGKKPEEKLMRQWIRARGRISDLMAKIGNDGQETERKSHNHQAHLVALAYMSDSYFIGSVARAHNLMRFSNNDKNKRVLNKFEGSDAEKRAMIEYLDRIAKEEEEENAAAPPNPEAEKRRIGMMVSLDHSIFFHNPRAFRADEWMLTEMATPWAGDGRGLVLQKIWSKDGILIATCTQEGVVRLDQQYAGRNSKI